MTKADLQLFIRSGGYAWPGGYQRALLMADGGSIDAQSARENYRQIRRNMAPNEPYSRDWTPAAVFIHWEGEPLICAHSGRLIPSAYGEITQ
jgi:hypothetical protein